MILIGSTLSPGLSKNLYLFTFDNFLIKIYDSQVKYLKLINRNSTKTCFNELSTCLPNLCKMAIPLRFYVCLLHRSRGLIAYILLITFLGITFKNNHNKFNLVSNLRLLRNSDLIVLIETRSWVCNKIKTPHKCKR